MENTDFKNQSDYPQRDFVIAAPNASNEREERRNEKWKKK